MLGFLKNALGSKVSKFSGQTDFLEAVCASCALVAAADNDISDAEVASVMKTIAANPALQGGFSPREIEQCAETMLKRAQGGRMGKMGLYREIEQAASDPDKAEAIILAALDVAESDGDIGPEEMAVLVKIGEKVRVDVKRLIEA
jgi:tellurite resistance protein TerB